MNRGRQALDMNELIQLDKNTTENEFVVSNCGYFIAESSAHKMNKSPTLGYLLIYLHKGRVELPMPNGKNHVVEGGSVIIYKPHEATKLSYLSDPVNERYYVYFQGKDVENFLKKLKLADKRYYSVGDLSSIIKNFLKIIDDFKYHGLNEHIFRTTYLLDILTTISNVINPPQINHYPENYKQILDDIEKHYYQKITLESLSNKYSISVSTLRRYFKKYADTSPMDYVNSIRLDRATFMLIESDMQISEISYNVGFDDPLYFSKFFKNKMGLSPREYRKKYKPQFNFKK